MRGSGYEAIPGFGALYDAVPIYAGRQDVPFWLSEAASACRTGETANVLELGCGTGRVLLPLARAGHAVTGVDQSPSMLERCRATLAAESPEVRGRVTLYEADIRDFSLPVPASGFDLAIAPFRVLQHLTTVDEQLRCLAAVRRHLAPGGRLAFDVFHPNYRLMVLDRSEEEEDTPELELPDGRHLRRTVRITAVHWVEQVIDAELIYYVRTGSVVERVMHAFPMRWYTVPELRHLLARGGFEVEHLYGSLDRAPLGDDSTEIIVVARKWPEGDTTGAPPT